MPALIKLSLRKCQRTKAGVYPLLAVFFFALTTQCLGQQAETIQYEYDRLDRVTKVTYVSSGASISYTYDAAGNRIATTIQGTNLAPVITTLNPSGTTAGSRGFRLGINGNNLINGATVRWNGSNRAATYFGSYVTIDLTDADLATPGTFYVSVINPAPGGIESNALTFTVSQPGCALRVDTVTPVAGRTAGGQQIKLVGSFANLSAVKIGGVSASLNSTDGTSEAIITTPAHAPGAVSIDLQSTSGATCTKSNAFAYLPTVFTDDTLLAGLTTAKVQHVLELRQAIDALRAVAGLGAANWTDASLVPTGSIIKAVYIQELRMFLDDAAVRLGYPTAPYTDSTLSFGFSIKRVHLEELRQRIRAIAG